MACEPHFYTRKVEIIAAGQWIPESRVKIPEQPRASRADLVTRVSQPRAPAHKNLWWWWPNSADCRWSGFRNATCLYLWTVVLSVPPQKQPRFESRDCCGHRWLSRTIVGCAVLTKAEGHSMPVISRTNIPAMSRENIRWFTACCHRMSGRRLLL
jgi:hypothetical protein